VTAFRPPGALCGDPELLTLPPGSALWRVHGRLRPADQFNLNAAKSVWDGGRFDSTPADHFPFLYAGFSPETALCETLLRDLPFESGSRQLLRKNVRDRVLSRLTTTAPLTLLSLVSTAHLAKICQHNDWLVHAEGLDYNGTRDWASWLRKQVADAQGLIWCSRRNVPERSIVLFGDRCPGGTVLTDRSVPSRRLDDVRGAEFLNLCLAPYAVTVSAPPG
jgi:hypothetical protein